MTSRRPHPTKAPAPRRLPIKQRFLWAIAHKDGEIYPHNIGFTREAAWIAAQRATNNSRHSLKKYGDYAVKLEIRPVPTPSKSPRQPGGDPPMKARPGKVAVHEAAHAVIAWVLHCKIKEIRLLGEHRRKLQGFTVWRAPKGEKPCPVTAVLIAMAGSDAEVLWMGADPMQMSTSDINYLRKIGLSPVCLKLLQPISLRLLRAEKALIFRVARAVEEKRRVTWRQFCRLIREELDAKRPRAARERKSK